MARDRGETFLDVVHDVVSVPDLTADLDAPVVGDRIPEGIEWRYEPDWDGLRVIVHRRDDAVGLESEQHRPLARYFPEVVWSLSGVPFDDVTLRGSLVVVRPEGFSFDLLRRRIHPSASRVAEVAGSWPATLVITDIVAEGPVDLRMRDLDDRRRRL